MSMEDNKITNEAAASGIVPDKDMKDEDFHEWRENLNPDAMGFVGKEGVDM